MVTEAEPSPIHTDDAVEAIRKGDGGALARRLAADPELARARTEGGTSLLLFALYNRRPELAALLRERRDTLDVFEAAATGDLAELRRELGARPTIIDEKCADGFTALHLAAFYGQDRAARVLLASGADVEATAGEGTGLRPLHSAAASRRAGTVRLLLAAGADPDVRQAGGYTALHAAAMHGDLAMAAALLANGADATIATDDGSDALSFAHEAGAERIEALVRASVLR